MRKHSLLKPAVCTTFQEQCLILSNKRRHTCSWGTLKLQGGSHHIGVTNSFHVVVTGPLAKVMWPKDEGLQSCWRRHLESFVALKLNDVKPGSDNGDSEQNTKRGANEKNFQTFCSQQHCFAQSNTAVTSLPFATNSLFVLPCHD